MLPKHGIKTIWLSFCFCIIVVGSYAYGIDTTDRKVNWLIRIVVVIVGTWWIDVAVDTKIKCDTSFKLSCNFVLCKSVLQESRKDESSGTNNDDDEDGDKVVLHRLGVDVEMDGNVLFTNLDHTALQST